MKLDDVKDQVGEDDTGKWDLLLERDQLRFHEGRLRLPRSSRGIEQTCGAEKGLQLTNWATAQMCQRLSIPTSYFRRCPAPLQDAQVNHWLHEAPETENESGQSNQSNNWLLRAKGGTLRGVLSDRYSKLNNSDVLDCLLPVLSGTPFEVNWFAVTEESLHLRLFDPRLSREILPGDRVMAGLHIGNSEVGKRAITVDALVYRLVCQNGLVRLVKGKSLLHQRHVGFSNAKEDLRIGLGNAIQEALIQSSGFMERLSQATHETVTDMEGAIALIASESGLSQKTVEMVKAALGEERVSQRDTLFGLVNALTHTAQKLSPDARYALEATAGKFLESGISHLNNFSTAARKGHQGHRQKNQEQQRQQEEAPKEPTPAPPLSSPVRVSDAIAVTDVSSVYGNGNGNNGSNGNSGHSHLRENLSLFG